MDKPKQKFWRKRRGNNRGNFQGRGNRLKGQYGGNRNDFYNQNQGNFTGNYQPQPRVQREVPKKLSEEDIGVTQYLNDHAGFNGIIKARYSDFIVSEINLNGEVAKLTNLEPPELPKEKDIDEDEDLVLDKYNLEILPMETWDNINKLAVAQEPCTEKVEIDVTGMTKEQRTRIHDVVKKAFGKGIIGCTVSVDDKKFVTFEKYRKGVRVDKRVKWPWPGEYTYFVLHKENCDTMEAAVRLAERLRISLKPTTIGYAGTKDRRGKTSQWFSVRKMQPERLAAAMRDLPDIRIGNYTFANQGLKLGMLKGNMFRIVLRNVLGGNEKVDGACQLLQRDGFINYYGLQRFGSSRETPTHEIGRRLFQGKLLEAINLILRPRPGPLQHVFELYHEQGARAAWQARPRVTGASAEMRVLEALAGSPNDLIRAIDRIPRNARLLYIHSYQSLVWNRVATRRLQSLGRAPAVGDLVQLGPDAPEEEYIEEEYTDTEEDPDADTGKDDSTKDSDTPDPVEESPSKSKKKKKDKQVRKEVPVKVLTQEDVDSGRYSITDVLLPLPGNAVQYPPNMLSYYTELLTADGLTLDMKNKYKQFRMSGAYRRLVVRPGDVVWRAQRYSEPFADLQRSDRDDLEGRPLPVQTGGGKFKALLLTFTLPTSCYATMALRELMKVDTSSDNQASQNDYYKAKLIDINKLTSDNTGPTTNNTEQTTDDNTEQKTNDNTEQTTNDNTEQTTNDNTEQTTNDNTEQKTNDNTEQTTNDNSEGVNKQIKSEEEIGSGEKRKLDIEEEVNSKRVKQDE